MEEKLLKIQEQRAERTRKRKQQVRVQKILFGAAGVILLLGTAFFMRIFPVETGEGKTRTVNGIAVDGDGPLIDVQLLTVNEYSRPGLAVDKINGVVIHYTANPGSTAKENRDYFENLKDTHDTKASSNFIVGLEGEIIQCVPTNEIAYASNSRNSDTVSIETCHPDDTGKFNEATYRSLVELTAFLCRKFDLDSDSIIRHYDVTGKICPKYFVENEDAWEAFKMDVAELIK